MSLDFICDRLEDLGFSTDVVNQFADAVEENPLSPRPLSTLAKIVCDTVTLNGVRPAEPLHLASTNAYGSNFPVASVVYALFHFAHTRGCPYISLFEAAATTKTSFSAMDAASLLVALAPIFADKALALLFIDWIVSEAQTARIRAATPATPVEEDTLVGSHDVDLARALHTPPEHLSLTHAVGVHLTAVADALSFTRSLAPAPPLTLAPSLTKQVSELLSSPDCPASFRAPPLFASMQLSSVEQDTLAEITAHLNTEYRTRRAVALQRLRVTLQNFVWACKGDQQRLSQMLSTINSKLAHMCADARVGVEDLRYIGVNIASLPRASNPLHTLHTRTRVKHVVMAPVPDRGGRTRESQIHVRMPTLSARQGGQGGGRGGRGGHNHGHGLGRSAVQLIKEHKKDSRDAKGDAKEREQKENAAADASANAVASAGAANAGAKAGARNGTGKGAVGEEREGEEGGRRGRGRGGRGGNGGNGNGNGNRNGNGGNNVAGNGSGNASGHTGANAKTDGGAANVGSGAGNGGGRDNGTRGRGGNKGKKTQ